MTHRLAALVLAGAVLVAGCSASDNADGPAQSAGPTESSNSSGSVDSSQPSASIAPADEPADIVTGLDAPWSIVFVDDAPLISERDSGNILEVVGDRTRVVGAVADVAPAGEGGLLGLAVREEFLYVYFTSDDGDNRVVRHRLTGSTGNLGLGPVESVLAGIPGGRTHNGGRIAFGPDGMLYISTGDAQDRPKAQDPGSLSGKILRITPDGDVPADNPTAGSPMWSLGHRNVQGIAWAADGTMFSSEYGQDTWDELNVITKGGNYGWPRVEGMSEQFDSMYIDPVQQWNPDDASPSGMTIAENTIYIANLRGERIRAVPVAAPDTGRDLFVGEFGRVRDVTVARDGSLWLLTNNTDGRGDARDGDDRIKRVTVQPG